jgi:cytochrome c biogenesis protein CcmG/thiol:disulfide interchange protein DsbE
MASTPRSINPVPYAIGIVVLAVLAAVYFTRGKDRSETPQLLPGAAAAETIGEGSRAPAFTLVDVKGTTVSLGDLKGQVVLLNFWATWCPPCKAEIPDFIDFQKKYAARGLRIVGIALDEKEAVETYLSSSPLNYLVLLGDQSVAARYGNIESIPTTFLIDRDGVIRHVAVGLQQRAEWERSIEALL